MTVMLRLRQVPARRGAAWVREGFSVFARRPLAFAVLFAVFMGFVLVGAMVPLVGPLLVPAALPLVSLGFMLATQRTLQGRFPGPGVFLAPLRVDGRTTRALLELGLLYALGAMAVMALSDFADGGTFEALQVALAGGRIEGGDAARREQVASLFADPRLQAGMLLRLGLAALLALPFWHAPALIYRARHGVGQSMFSSTLACWRNRGAFLIYGLTWMGVTLGFGVAADLLAVLLSSLRLIVLSMLLLTLLLLPTVLYASLYFTFVDCFTQDEADEGHVAAIPADGDGTPQP